MLALGVSLLCFTADRDERDDRVGQGLQLLRHRGPGAGQAGAAGVRHPPLPQVTGYTNLCIDIEYIM